MINVETVQVWVFEHAIRGMELKLLKYLFNHYGRFEVKKYDKG